MSDLAKEIIPITIETELKQSYLDYAMSVIIGRALPDVRDGLKPVHRRVLFAMHELGNDWNKPYKKSARIVGDVIGKYHPHGDTAIYDTIVRMAQPFSLRYTLVDGQGNFGSVDGDAPAAMRYTEIRMSRLAHYLLADLDRETVDFTPNYDETELIPVVLPTRIPNLLVNGSSGIAVGMATNIPPHNLNEIIDATLALIERPEISIQELMQWVPGPDFPTAAIINGRAGIAEAYRTGRGRVVIRAKTEIEYDEDSGKSTILVHELPYQVNKARLLEKIAELVKEKQVEGITALRDESDKDGLRVVIELRRGEQAEVILNNLFAHTQLQVVFGINIVALDNGQPKTLNLKQLLEAFLKHRREVVTRRTIYELRKTRERAHTLEGLAVALANIDPLIATIKAAKTPAEAREALLARAWAPGSVGALLNKETLQHTRMAGLSEEYGLKEQGYYLSPEQAQAILELKLHRLTGLEIDKIHTEYDELVKLIQELIAILSSPERLNEVIRTELREVKEQFGDPRRTQIIDAQADLDHEDLIAEENRVVTLSQAGYIKSQSLDSYQAQRRGGRGKMAAAVKEEDVVTKLLIAHTHDYILCFSTLGKVYWLKTYQVPLASRTARGRPVVNLLPLAADESISAILPVTQFDENHYVLMATRRGTAKKVPLSDFSRPRANGIIAIDLSEGDHLVGVSITDGERELMLVTSSGKAIRFHEREIRAMGRTAHGVRGVRLQEAQELVALIVIKEGGTVLAATEHGYGQRTAVEDYRAIGRGGQGVIAIQTSERNGKVVGAVQVFDNDEAMLITDKGTLVRIRVSDVSVIGRNTQGVRLINLSEGESLVSIERIEALEDENSGSEDVVDDAEGDELE